VKIDPNNTDKNAPTKMMSVYDYFVERYNIYLEYWFLPLVETPGGAMYPMEVCTVKANQRYPFKIGPDQTDRMIKFAFTRPKERIGAIQQ
jgi:eukaryotic translation initiation factor 2C